MNVHALRLAVVAALGTMSLGLAASAHAQGAPAPAAGAPAFEQRDINQQKRIEQGLQSGELNTREAAKLEREQARVGKMEARALSDGNLTAGEKARINAAQNATSAGIAKEKHDAQKGNPDSASSQRMQASVQRNINQQTRIQQGMASGELTNKEAARLEAGQSRVMRREARTGADGHVNAVEHGRVAASQNAQSARIHRQKHDGQAK